MKNHWHEQIQRYLNGQSSAEESAALHEALNQDAELRALYLDYMNLDVALGAAAEMATIAENGTGRTIEFSQQPAQLSSRYDWLGWGIFAAVAALMVFGLIGMLVEHYKTSRPQPDVAAAISSTQKALARLSVEPPSLFPDWASPTASLLDPPRIPE